MKPYLSIILVLLLILLSECSSRTLRKQRKHYEKSTSGVKYKTYRTASKIAIAGFAELYNKKQPDSLQIDGHYAHLLLGYFWSISEKLPFAFAEADIVEEKGNERNDLHLKNLAHSLRYITMYQAGWNKLAEVESTKAVPYSADQGSKKKYEAAVFYLLMGTVYTKEKDFVKARPFWNGFATETKIHWPYLVNDAAADFQTGNTQQGLQKIKSISQDPTLPKPIRDELTLALEKQADISSANSFLAWTPTMGKIIWQELKNSSHKGFNKIVDSIEEIGGRL